ncbi:uncharacterized protein V6R79_011376 [Siganus canaliculatus]
MAAPSLNGAKELGEPEPLAGGQLLPELKGCFLFSSGCVQSVASTCSAADETFTDTSHWNPDHTESGPSFRNHGAAPRKLHYHSHLIIINLITFTQR